MDDQAAQYTVVELDQDADGTAMRAELADLVGRTSVPAIWIGGEFVGGATDLFDIGKAGELQPMLAAKNINYNEVINRDPYSFLPDWLHPR